MGRVLSLNVVGVAHPNKDGGNRRTEIMFCDVGEPVELRLEPKNPVDPNAVAVFSDRGFQMGYLTAERAPWIGGMLKNRVVVTAVFQEGAPWGAVIRVGLDGAVPILPEPAPRSAPRDEDQYIDEDPEDDYDQTR